MLCTSAPASRKPPQRRDRFVRGHAELPAEPLIARVALVGRVARGRRPAIAIRSASGSSASTSRSESKWTRSRGTRIAGQPGVLGGAVDQQLVGGAAKATAPCEFELADDFDAAPAVAIHHRTSGGKRMGLEREPGTDRAGLRARARATRLQRSAAAQVT